MVRRKACRGQLPVSLQERIEILVVLAADREGQDQTTALQTLLAWRPEELQQVLRDPATPVAVLDFAATNLAPLREELGDALLQNPGLPGPPRLWLENALALIAEAKAGESSEGPAPPPPSSESDDLIRQKGSQKPETAIQRTQRMTVVQKVKAALIGNQEERMILIRDNNKLVARAVMQSPKLTEQEVEKYASMKEVCEEALRIITLNRKFMKLYVVVRALVNNPRTPIDVGLHLLPRINEFDLKRLSMNRNVADVIRHTAEKIIRRKDEVAKEKHFGKH